MAGALGVCVAAVYYVMNLRISQRNQELSLKAQQQTADARQAQLYLQLYSQYYQKDWLDALHNTSFVMKFKDFDDWWEKYGPETEYFNSLEVMSHYFEGAGVLVKRGLLDPSLITDLLSEEFIGYWEKYAPIIQGFRVKAGNPHLCENQEYMYNLIKQRDPSLKTTKVGIIDY
jgi:hypothetical protein